jgi:type I restriction enzyme S subunit
MKSIPPNWVWSTIGELYNIVGGGTPSTNKPEYWSGDIPWISSADIFGLEDIRPRKYINDTAIKESAANLVPKGSIIVVTRVGLGKVALTNSNICFSQDSQALIGNGSFIIPEYALYYLSKAVQLFKYDHRGTTIAGVTKKQLSELIFPLAPIAEQHRIVAKIEELFSRLDAGVEALQKAKAQLQRYRQSVLKAAVEGRLTEEWRKAHPDVKQTEVLMSSFKWTQEEAKAGQRRGESQLL